LRIFPNTWIGHAPSSSDICLFFSSTSTSKSLSDFVAVSLLPQAPLFMQAAFPSIP
jgi:hypothetical protein